MRARWLFMFPVVGLAVALCLVPRAPTAAQSAPGRGDGVPEWTMVYGGFKHLDDVVSLSDGSAWGVDRLQIPGGLRQSGFVRWQDGIWRVTQVLEGILLTAVDFAGPSTGFAVGLEGALVRWNGTYWQRMPAPVGRDLRDVSLGAPDDGWACGDYGTLLRWDGRDWRQFELEYPLSSYQYTSVYTLPSGEAWATALGGQVLRYRDGSWQVQNTPEILRPIQIVFNGPARALVVGGGALELRAGEWQTVGEPNTSYRSAAWVGDVAYGVANDELVLYRDGVWRPVAIAPSPGNLAEVDFERVIAAAGGAWAVSTTGQIAWLANGEATYSWPPVPRLEALDLASPDTLWAAGEVVSAGFVGRVDGQWRTEPGPEEGATVWDLDLLPDDDGWGVSFAPAPLTTEFWRWDGTAWSDWPTDKTWRLSRVQMLSGDDGWMAGGNVVVRWRGTGWQAMPGVPAGATGALSMLRGGDDPWGWFGGIGFLFQLVGQEWTSVELPELEQIVTIDMVAEDVGWAITPTTLYRFDGTKWQPVTTPRPELSRFRDLDAPRADQVWVLMDPPGLLHWTGLAWEVHDLTPLGGNARFTRIRACVNQAEPGCTEVWMAGSPPAIARYRVLSAVSQLALPVAYRPE